MPVSPARAAAFDILLRVERESSYASELLHSKTYTALSTQDHALATELVMGVLRWRSRLDDEIATASSQSLAKLDKVFPSSSLVSFVVKLFRGQARIAQCPCPPPEPQHSTSCSG